MKIKRILAFSVSLCIVFCRPVFAADNTANKIAAKAAEIAEVTFGDGMTKNSGVSEAVMATSGTVTVNDRGGRKAWLLQSASDSSGSIRINLSDAFAFGNTDGTSYTVEVDYLDADKSVFNVIYDSLTSDTKETECVYLGTSQEWRTARFELDDADFSNRLYGRYDLCVTVRSKSIRFSSGNVLIGGVRVYKHTAANPVRITSIKSSELGNIFGNGQDKSFDVEYTNYSDTERSFDVICTATDADRAVVSEMKKSITLAPNEVHRESVPVTADRYGLYDFHVSLTGNGFSHSDEVPFSFINNCTDGSKNMNFGYLDVTDDIHSAQDKDANIWKNDSVQFGVTFEQRDHDMFVGGTFTEISFGDTPDGPVVWRHGAEDNAFPTGKIESAKVAFRRDGDHSCYEISVPWSEITAKSIDFDSLSRIGFSMLVNDNDGSGRKGWIEYGSGIGKTKDTSLFTFLNVIK